MTNNEHELCERCGDEIHSGLVDYSLPVTLCEECEEETLLSLIKSLPHHRILRLIADVMDGTK